MSMVRFGEEKGRGRRVNGDRPEWQEGHDPAPGVRLAAADLINGRELERWRLRRSLGGSRGREWSSERRKGGCGCG